MIDPKEIRDIQGDYIKANVAEYEHLKSRGRDEQAAGVAEILRKLGHEVESPRKAPAPTKETAVSPESLERAVEESPAPKRRGRPARAKDAE